VNNLFWETFCCIRQLQWREGIRKNCVYTVKVNVAGSNKVALWLINCENYCCFQRTCPLEWLIFQVLNAVAIMLKPKVLVYSILLSVVRGMVRTSPALQPESYIFHAQLGMLTREPVNVVLNLFRLKKKWGKQRSE
jgi:hypothetical protein